MSTLTIKENSFIDNRTSGDITDPKDKANLKKATINNSNPPKLQKKISKVPAVVLDKLFNDSIEKSGFPQNLKIQSQTKYLEQNGVTQ